MNVDIDTIQAAAVSAIADAAAVGGSKLAGVPVAVEGEADFGRKVQAAESAEGISIRIWSPLGVSAADSRGRSVHMVRYILTVIVRETPRRLSQTGALQVAALDVVKAARDAVLGYPLKPHPLYFQLANEDWLDRNEAEGGAVDHVLRFQIQGMVNVK